MYEAEYLSSYPFFQQALESVPLPVMHDSLTGVLSRPYMLDFIHDLIRRNMPFTLGIIDLDNFKSINDNYGHTAGDGVLSQVAGALKNYLGANGLVGRFGGDEYLIVYFPSNEYSHIHSFYNDMYRDGNVFRRDYIIDGLTLFITATVGSASFPDDAGDYETLFHLVDKTLYRGKSKGRNCYIIYVESKHAHLEIPTMAKRSLLDTLRQMAEGFDETADIRDKVRRAFAPIQENLRMSCLLYIAESGMLYDAISGQDICETGSIDSLMENGMYAPNNLAKTMDVNPPLAKTLVKLGYESALFFQADHAVYGPGCLILCPERYTMHLWQDDECTAAFFLARLLREDAALNR